MFTGYIEAVGTIAGVERLEADSRLRISAPFAPAGLALGHSVAVDGVCLTVTALGPGWFAADLSHESLARTTLAQATAGWRVNLERALAAGERLHGHLVQGHVDGVGELSSRTPRGRAVDLALRLPPELLTFCTAKGSIAIDGVSLTINALGLGGLGLTLVPHTIARTALAAKAPGASVNVEVDILAKYVARLLHQNRAPDDQPAAGQVTMDLLKEEGYL